jgi:general secretion pathway protein G
MEGVKVATMSKQRRWRWLAVGIAIIVILALISIPMYRSMLLNTREAVLNNNLTEMRRAIKQYIKDKQRAPQSLQDLVDAGYFRQLPIDPIMNSNSSWKPVIENVVVSAGQTDRGITDLHSGSSSISSKGTIYNAW